MLKTRNHLGTALHCVVANDHEDVALYILDSIDPSKTYSLVTIRSDLGRTVLHECCYSSRGCLKVVEQILGQIESGQQQKLLFAKDTAGCTALHYAAKRDHVNLITVILEVLKVKELKARLLDSENNARQTALELAVELNSEETVSALKSVLDALESEKGCDKKGKFEIGVYSEQATGCW